MVDKRSHARYPIELDVLLLHGGIEHSGRSQDLSLGGMFVLTDARLAFGTDIAVSLLLPAIRERTALEATVRWHRIHGIGLGFRSLRARDVWALNALFRSIGLRAM